MFKKDRKILSVIFPIIFSLFCFIGNNYVLAESGGSADTSGSAPVDFKNPIQAESVSQLVDNVLMNLRGILVGITLAVITIGAIMYILSTGDDKKMSSAKNVITYALIGLAIALAAPVFLREIINILGGANSGLATDKISGSLTLKDIVTNVLNFLLGIVGVLSLIAMVFGGFTYLTAYGNEKRAEEGKNIFKASVIGIALALGALVLVKQVAFFFQ